MKKRLLCVLLSISLLFSSFGTVVAEEVVSDYVLDSTTKTYAVYTDAGFRAVADLINGGNYSYNISLAKNITLSKSVNLGTKETNPYSGTINGYGYTLSGVVANGNGKDGQALVLYSAGMTVKDLHLNVNIDAGTNSYVAGFLYKNVSGATFENCSVSGTLTGAGFIGGFVALNSSTLTINNCSSAVNITASAATAGVFVANSTSKLTVNGSDVYASTVTATGNVGGIIGLSSGSVSASNSSVFGVTLTSTGNYVGGILGRLNGTSLSCENVAVEADISAVSHSGGILGGDGYSASTASTPSTYPKIICKNIVTAGTYNSSTSYAGGFIGYNVNVDITLTNCVSFADLTAGDYVGGYAANLRGGVLNFTNCIYAGDITSSGKNKGNITGYVEIKYANQTAAFTNCYVWGATKVAMVSQISIADGVTPVVTVDGTSTTWAKAQATHLTAAGIKSRITNYMKDFNDELTSLAEYCQNEYTHGAPGALAISEISHCPKDQSYEYIEIVNTSDSNVSLDGYTIIRNACVNSGAAQRNIIQRFVGTNDTLSPTNIAALNIKNTNITLAPNETALLWIVSYKAKDKKVSDFTSYWNGLGNDISNVKVARVPQYNSDGDLFPATGINSKCGNGFLPDKYGACSISLVNAENSAKRASNGSTLSNITLPLTTADTNMILELSDSFAMYFTGTTAQSGSSYNFYDFIDEEAYRRSLSEFLPTVLHEQRSNFPLTVIHRTMVTGELDGNGLPKSFHYPNNTENSKTYTPYIDYGTLKTTSTPGKLISGQHVNIRMSDITVVDSDTVKVTGYAKNTKFAEVGFILYTESASGVVKNTNKKALTSTVASNGKFTVTLDGFPVKNGDIIGVVPCGVSADGETSTGKHTFIRYPQKSVVIHSARADSIRVAYFSDQEETTDYRGYYEAAKLFAEDLQYYTGKSVALVPFDKHASYRQIVFCSPTAAKEFIPSSLSVGASNYAILGRYGNIFIIGGDALAAEYASQTIISALKTSTAELDLQTFCTGTSTAFNPGTNNLPLTEGANFRIMTCNVLRYELYQNLERISDFVKTFKYYSPDVIGFQEYCATFTSQLTPKLKDLGYTVLGNEMRGGDQNFTPLAYKTARFNCIDKGWFRLSGESNYPGHNVTWAVLQDKTTGEKFAVSTTHFFHLSDRTQADPIRAINAQEILDLSKQLVSKHNCAVVNMGDYNTYSTDVGYPVFFQDNFLHDARFVSERGLYLERTSHVQAVPKPADGSLTMALDIFHVTDLTRVVRFRPPINTTTGNISDHFPSYLDIAVSKSSDYKLNTKAGSGVTLEKSGNDSIIKVPAGTTESELLSYFDSNVRISGGIATGSKIVNYLGSIATDSAYIVLENDVSGDGEINGKDVVRAKKYMLGIENNKINIIAGDKNNDGKINDSEISALVDLIPN